MKQYTCFSPRASLAILGQQTQKWEIWKTIGEHVQIHQKTVSHTPLEKLQDAWIGILAGGHGMVEINTRVRPDRGLQLAFGRKQCAEQSTVSQTLTACTQENVQQLRHALQLLFQTHSQAFSHPYLQQDLEVDVDMSGLTSGKQAEGASKGYFAGQKNRRGRQLGRALASQYGEVIYEQLYPGTVQLEGSLQHLVLRMEDVLAVNSTQRKHIILRVDGGGGRDADVNWLLECGYGILIRVRQWQRARNLAKRVQTWYVDPQDLQREWGQVEEPFAYKRPTRQIAVRYRKSDQSWTYRVLVTNLSDEQLFYMARQPMSAVPTPPEVLFAAVIAYDLRGGGVETSLRQSKQGMGLNKRNKKSFHAQEMLVLLAQLAYHLLLWVRHQLSQHHSQWRAWGILRMVRDVCAIPGKLQFDKDCLLIQVVLNRDHPLAGLLHRTYLPFCQEQGLSLILRKI
jgi:hypothetical protein